MPDSKDRPPMGLARLMVRRHCKDILATGADLDVLARAFIVCASASPNTALGDVAEAFRETCWEMLRREVQKFHAR